MTTDALISLVSIVDRAVEKRDLSFLYERCGILLPHLRNLNIDTLPSELAVTFAEAIYTIERWSKDVRGANIEVWPDMSAKLKEAIRRLGESHDNFSATVIKNFWSDKQYAILNENLGSGAFGRTILIRDEDIGLVQVAKVYEPKHLRDVEKERFFQFFKDEIKILHALNHRNIVRVYAAHLYSSRKAGIILMEFVKGVSLDEYIMRYNPDKDDINDVFLQAVDAFTYLEGQGVFHRDIRPSNLMITEEGVVKIIDFGCGKIKRKDETRTDSLATVVCHDDAIRLPDERYDREYDSKTDMFYLGEMFGRLVKGSKCDGIFRYDDECAKMSSESPLLRYSSFKDLVTHLNEKSVLTVDVTDEEKQTYLDFANSLCSLIVSRDLSSEIKISSEAMISGLDLLIEQNLFEVNVQNPGDLISMFIEGGCYYHQNRLITVEVVKAFRDWFSKSSSRKRELIIKSIRAKLGTVKILESNAEVLPF